MQDSFPEREYQLTIYRYVKEATLGTVHLFNLCQPDGLKKKNPTFAYAFL